MKSRRVVQILTIFVVIGFIQLLLQQEVSVTTFSSQFASRTQAYHSLTFSWQRNDSMLGEDILRTSVQLKTTGQPVLTPLNETVKLLPLNESNVSRNVSCNATDLMCLAARVATQTPASNAKTLTVVVLDDSYVEMFYNFAEAALKAGVGNLLPVSLGKKAHNELEQNGYQNYLEISLSHIASQENRFLSQGFKQKGAMKFIVSLQLLEKGYSVLLLDLDNFIVSNPFRYFNCGNCDLEIQQDAPKDSWWLCVGQVFFRPTWRTVLLLQDMTQRMRDNPSLWDQELLNELLHKSEKHMELKYRNLPFQLFPTGYELHHKSVLPHSFDLRNKIIFHNNWCYGYRSKRYLAKEVGAWIVDTNGYYSSPDRKYLTYSSTRLEYTHRQGEFLKEAMQIGRYFNRTVILPPFLCLGKSKPVCTLDQIENINTFDTDFENKYRESSFLGHSKVPLSVKQSISPPLLIITKLTEKKLLAEHYFTNQSIIFRPKHMDIGPTFVELREWFQPYNHYSVLKLHSVYFKIKT